MTTSHKLKSGQAVRCLRCGAKLFSTSHFVPISGPRLKGESLGCKCGFSMMKADLAYKIRAKERNRWWLRLCARTRQEWLFRLLAPKPYRISGVYGAWHYADNAAKTPNENAQAQPPKETPERKGDL